MQDNLFWTWKYLIVSQIQTIVKTECTSNLYFVLEDLKLWPFLLQLMEQIHALFLFFSETFWLHAKTLYI